MPPTERQIKKIAEFSLRAKESLQKSGYEVQTLRIVTQPWEKYYESEHQIEELVKGLDTSLPGQGIDYFSIGTTFSPEHISLLYSLLKKTSSGFATVMVSDAKTINYAAARGSARLMKQLSRLNADGFTNLRFAALFNVKPGCPFFPAAYHTGPMTFALGTENSDLVYQAFSEAGDIRKAAMTLESILISEYRRLEKTAERISSREKVRFGGIDLSIASSSKRNQSIAFAFEKLGLGRFGEAGTLAVARLITDTIQNLPIKKCGYSGLMLPLLEDFGLARRNSEGFFDVNSLLLYSSVCGTGLDTIPLPGNVSEKKLYALLLDIAALSGKLNKPLSARLMPIPGKSSGDMTTYSFEYFVNSRIMSL